MRPDARRYISATVAGSRVNSDDAICDPNEGVAVTIPTMMLAMFLGLAAQTGERVDPMAETVAKWFTMIERSFVALADAMPENRWGFAPTDGEFNNVRTFAQQIKHVACANVAFFNEVERKVPPDGCEAGGPSPARTKGELMTYLRESFGYASRVMRALTPSNAMDPVEGPYGGKTTRLGISTLAVWHATDHYGQLVIYLRMNGIVPPSTAAEGR